MDTNLRVIAGASIPDRHLRQESRSQLCGDNGSMESIHWPSEIRLAKDRRQLLVTFEDGRQFTLAAEYLRVSSPSAEVRGHGPGDRKTVAGKKNVEIIGVEPVGRYAVKLVFDDLHDTGIYTWDYLYELGSDFEARWQAYLAELEEKGLSREPPRRR